MIDEGMMYGLASVLAVLFAGAVVLVPILALSARYALRPVMETWIRLRQAETSDQEKILQDRRIALLEAEVQSLQKTLQRHTEAESCERQLNAPPSS